MIGEERLQRLGQVGMPQLHFLTVRRQAGIHCLQIGGDDFVELLIFTGRDGCRFAGRRASRRIGSVGHGSLTFSQELA
jgi:hypothetical protein